MSLEEYKKKYQVRNIKELSPEEQNQVCKEGKVVGVEMVGWYDTTYILYKGVVYQSDYYTGD